jgi:hypothetical protein
MRKADRTMAGQNHAASEPRLGIYLAKSRFLIVMILGVLLAGLMTMVRL